MPEPPPCVGGITRQPIFCELEVPKWFVSWELLNVGLAEVLFLKVGDALAKEMDSA
jgi:hypothetical protein